MQHPSQIDVWQFEWDDENLEHQTHGLTPAIAELVKDNSPEFFRNKPGKTGSHQMIGPDINGRFWTVIILATPYKGRWRPITGWPSDANEIQKYRYARAG